jgi:cyclic-di-GMP-binding protein
LRYVKGETRQIQVGEVVAIRPRERRQWHACLVRRIVNAGAARLEVGLQLLSPEAVPVALDGAGSDAVFLPTMPEQGGRAGLIAPAGVLADGREFALSGTGGNRTWRVERQLEANPRCEIWLLRA